MNEISDPAPPSAASSRRPPAGLVRMTEPVARALAGHRWMPLWAVVRHRGRRSGTPYQTPIAVVPTTDTSIVLIGLPWGSRTNWARNLVAAGGGSLRWRGRDVVLVRPRIIDGAAARRLARSPFGAVVSRLPAAIVLDRG